MPTQVVNGARIFYRTFGARGGTPILLIHGATADGTTDWGAIAPALGLSRRVIVPDCRGHGRSTNPGDGYSFRQMASDLAELIRAGSGRAHVVGHSNGGNVALVMAVEHPDVLASCVIQAANAFVSEDLIAAEPRIFDPDRVERDDPAWRDQMIRLHGRWHGRDYWRRLLRLTGEEIISAPNYGPDDLASVTAAALVIEGQDDRLNAASEHGTFIATHIRDAELWRPEGVGHTVHEERPTEWLQRVEDFWVRRGTEVRDGLWRLWRGTFRDRRSWVFDVKLPPAESEVPSVTVLEETAEQIRAGVPGEFNMTSLRPAEPGIVRAAITDVLAFPQDGAERLTQALYGELVDRFDQAGVYRRVRTIADAYVGWVRDAALAATAAPTLATHRIAVDNAPALDGPDGLLVLRLPFGARVTIVGEDDDWLEIEGPRKSHAWIARGSARPAAGPLSLLTALDRFQALVGTPYLWGGRSPWGFDCSGLAQRFHDELGIQIPRDADQQWRAGIPVDSPARPGDLLFYSSPGVADPSIRHVGIALDSSRLLHAWGAAGAVVVTDLAPPVDDATAALADAFKGARRFIPRGRADG